MHILRVASGTALAAWLLVLCGTVNAQGTVGTQTNPLYEHRRSLSSGPGQESILAVSVSSTSRDGRVVLDVPSARLLGDGVQSGDPVVIELGRHSIRAYVGFSDEVARSKSYHATTQKQAPVEPGVVLIVNRHNPTERIVLDSSAGGAVMNLGVETGQTVVVRLFRAVPRTDRGAN